MTDVRRSEERFRSLVRNASDCIVIARADGTVAYESPAVERVLGYAPDNRLGRPAFEDVHPEDVAWIERLFRDVGATPDAQAAATIRVRHRDGSWRSLEVVTKNMLDDPAVRGIVVNYRDITERQTLEDQLRHQAFHDALTGLPNRALFLDRLEHARSQQSRRTTPAGRRLPRSRRLQGRQRQLGPRRGRRAARPGGLADPARRCASGDTAARMGGDEFAVLLEDAAGRPSVPTPRSASSRPSGVRSSIGSPAAVRRARAPGSRCRRPPARPPTSCIRNADVAMYIAKQQGKDRLIVFSAKVHDATIERLQLRTDLTRGPRARRVHHRLPAGRRPRDGRDPGRRGARALAPPAARAHRAERIHPARRGERRDRADRPLGPAAGVPCRPRRGGRLAPAADDHERQPVRPPDRGPRPGRRCRGRARRERAAGPSC